MACGATLCISNTIPSISVQKNSSDLSEKLATASNLHQLALVYGCIGYSMNPIGFTDSQKFQKFQQTYCHTTYIREKVSKFSLQKVYLRRIIRSSCQNWQQQWAVTVKIIYDSTENKIKLSTRPACIICTYIFTAYSAEIPISWILPPCIVLLVSLSFLMLRMRQPEMDY